MKRMRKAKRRKVEPALIRSRKDVLALIEQLNEENGPGWHPDTPFEDMISLTTNLPAYDKREALARNLAIERAFDICGGGLYDLAIETWQARGWAPLPGDAEDEKELNWP